MKYGAEVKVSEWERTKQAMSRKLSWHTGVSIFIFFTQGMVLDK